jgi:hypothetical protein
MHAACAVGSVSLGPHACACMVTETDAAARAAATTHTCCARMLNQRCARHAHARGATAALNQPAASPPLTHAHVVMPNASRPRGAGLPMPCCMGERGGACAGVLASRPGTAVSAAGASVSHPRFAMSPLWLMVVACLLYGVRGGAPRAAPGGVAGQQRTAAVQRLQGVVARDAVDAGKQLSSEAGGQGAQEKRGVRCRFGAQFGSHRPQKSVLRGLRLTRRQVTRHPRPPPNTPTTS